ncbi:MAG: rhomboid family intramembrane serine protease [Planctomycetales bacterium]
MLFFPFYTDAPIYHYPITTVGLIVINICTFFATWQMDVNGETYQSLVLTFDGVRPLQWLTMNFMHEGIFHLIGNMIFLWAFGLIVEGKLGWYRFLPIYLLISILCGAILQLANLGSGGGALGASAVIYGVMGMSLVWAPSNKMSCYLIFVLGLMVRVVRVELAISTLASIYVGLDLVFLALKGFSFSGEAGHLLGFMLGMLLGTAFLKLDWVDCEGWDIFCVWAGSAGRIQTASEIREEMEENFKTTDEMRAKHAERERETAIDLLREHLNEGRARVAHAVFQKSVDPDGNRLELPEKELLSLIKGLNREGMIEEAVPLLVQAITRFPKHGIPIRLLLAKIMLETKNRPRQAIAILAKLPATLAGEQQQQRLSMEQRAQTAIEEGEMELEIKDW